MKNFYIRAIPYILTFFAGAGVFFISIYYQTDWSDWLVEISGALSAIPIVFLIYDYSNYKLSEKVNKKMAENLEFEVNSIIVKIIKSLKISLAVKGNLSWDLIEKMLEFRSVYIKKNLKTSKKDINEYRSFKQGIDELLYKASDSNAFESAKFDALAGIDKELSHIINELEFRSDKVQLSMYVSNLLSFIDSWVDMCEEDALKSHSHFQLAIDTVK